MIELNFDCQFRTNNDGMDDERTTNISYPTSEASSSSKYNKKSFTKITREMIVKCQTITFVIRYNQNDMSTVN